MIITKRAFVLLMVSACVLPVMGQSLHMIVPQPGHRVVIRTDSGEEDLVAFIRHKGGPQAAGREVVRLWGEGKIVAVPDLPRQFRPESDDGACLGARQNLQQWQNGVLIAQTFAAGLAATCWATGGPAVDPPICGAAVAASGIVLYAQYQLNQAQQAVARSCG